MIKRQLLPTKWDDKDVRLYPSTDNILTRQNALVSKRLGVRNDLSSLESVLGDIIN
jgi:hypothetical protein